jgi:2-dehydropantoate 2-reductase
VVVKSYDTESLVRAFPEALAEGAVVLSLQNGLGNLEVLARAFGRDRVLGAPVLIGAEMPAPAAVRVTVYAKPVKIGSPWGGPAGDREAARWAGVLAAAGIPAEPTDRLFAYLWEKVLYNAPLNPLGALLRVPYGVLAEHDDSRAVMDAVIDEAFSVALAEGVDLLWDRVDECRRHFYERLLPPTAHHRSSMLQDLERGKRTEIDALNGYIARRGTAQGIATPANTLLTRLVHFAEQRARAESVS